MVEKGRTSDIAAAKAGLGSKKTNRIAKIAVLELVENWS